MRTHLSTAASKRRGAEPRPRRRSPCTRPQGLRGGLQSPSATRPALATRLIGRIRQVAQRRRGPGLRPPLCVSCVSLGKSATSLSFRLPAQELVGLMPTAQGGIARPGGQCQPPRQEGAPPTVAGGPWCWSHSRCSLAPTPTPWALRHPVRVQGIRKKTTGARAPKGAYRWKRITLYLTPQLRLSSYVATCETLCIFGGLL